MKIYFAGLSGISNLSRLQVWIDQGMTKKLISYFEIMTGDGLKEWEFLIKRIKNDT